MQHFFGVWLCCNLRYVNQCSCYRNELSLFPLIVLVWPRTHTIHFYLCNNLKKRLSAARTIFCLVSRNFGLFFHVFARQRSTFSTVSLFVSFLILTFWRLGRFISSSEDFAVFCFVSVNSGKFWLIFAARMLF